MDMTLAIDPGIRHTGYAVAGPIGHTTTGLREFGLLLTSRTWPDVDRICCLMARLKQVCLVYEVDHVLVEDFQIFGRARVTKGYMRSAKLQGAVHVLPIITLADLSVYRPAEWQTSFVKKLGLRVKRDKKEAIQRRLMHRLNVDLTDHETDAIGILLNHLYNAKGVARVLARRDWIRNVVPAKDLKLTPSFSGEDS